MSAITSLIAEKQKQIVDLERQLEAGGISQKEIFESARNYLIQNEIYDVILIEEYDFRDYAEALRQSNLYSRKQIIDRTAALRKAQEYWVVTEYGELLEEIEQCKEADQTLTGNLKRFLIRQGIHHIQDMEYELREKYEEELCKARTSIQALRYLKTFDRIKQHSIREEISKGFLIHRPKKRYEERKIFLPYLPNQKLAMEFDRIQDKHELVWDFSRKAPKTLKQQIYTVLQHVLKNITDPKDRRVRYLLPLRWLYDFCTEQKIEDIECMEMVQIKAFEAVVEQKVVNVKNSMQIVDNSRKILFTCARDIHWYANVWYLEKFKLSPERLNPSNPVHSISFYEVQNKRNRKLLQDFARYLLGVTGLTVHNIRSHLNLIQKFLIYFEDEESICSVTEEQMESYLKELQMEKVKGATFNVKIGSIVKFYDYLEAKGHVEKIPFYPEYYLKKEIPTHHDRSVEEETYMEILCKLKFFPEKQRLIFLHLWCTGLRISEVCTLKGNSYYFDGEDAWIKIYQIKLKMDKLIPIPLILYQIVKIYIKRAGIQYSDYLFQGEGKGAYRATSFCKTFQHHCELNNIKQGDYIFKSHDYRHTMATRFYDTGISLQTIRDYLGHYTEDMTKQYVDFMPKKIELANDEYFKKPANNLASAITVRKRGGRSEEKNLSV